MKEKDDDITQLPHFSFAIKMLTAEVKLRSGNGSDALSQLISLKTAPEYSQSSSWRWRLDCTLINAAMRLHFWDLACEKLISLHKWVAPKIGQYEGDIQMQFMRADVILLCRLCRVYLSTGAMKLCQKYEQELRDYVLKYPSINLDTLNHMKHISGLLSFASNDLEGAMQTFAEILNSRVEPPRKSKETLLFDLTAGDVDLFASICQLEDPYYPSAANNLAVCAMHLGKVKYAVEVLESLIQQDPFVYLIDPVIFNLCTMYDISHSVGVAEMRKRSLRNVAEVYWLSDRALNWKSFRITSDEESG